MDYQENRISEWWRLPDEFTVHQAALLIVGVDPHSETGNKCKDWKSNEQPDGYGAVVQALISAIKGQVSGDHIPFYDQDINGNIRGEIEGTTDIHCSVVKRDSLVVWLESKGIRGGFFFPQVVPTTGPDYLDKNHQRYAPKLAAAVSAWLAVTDPKGKTPKQALDKWLRENAAKFGMVNDEGSPVEAAVTDCSKLANWEPGGGAPKTPGS